MTESQKTESEGPKFSWRCATVTAKKFAAHVSAKYGLHVEIVIDATKRLPAKTCPMAAGPESLIARNNGIVHLNGARFTGVVWDLNNQDDGENRYMLEALISKSI